MICNQCGKYMPDNSRFCPGCGASVQVVTAQNGQPTAQDVPSNTLIPDSPRLAALKKVARSPMMLIAALAFTAALVLNILNSVAINEQINNILVALTQLVGDEMGQVQVSTGNPLVSAISKSIPTILIALGLWITYFSAYKKNSMSTAGLTIIKVLQIISLVGVCVSGGIILLVEALVVFGGFALSNMEVGGEIAAALGNGTMTVGLIILGVTVVILTFVIVYFARIIGSINAATQVITNGRTAKKTSVFVAVLLIIGGIGTALGALTYLGMDALMQQIIEVATKDVGLPAEAMEILNGISFTSLALPQIMTAVATFLFGLLIFSYKSNVQDLVVAPPAPAYAHEVYQPVAVAVGAPAAEPVVEEPVVEEPVAENPVAEEPVAEEPVAEEPVAEEPVAEEPVAEEPVAEEPVAEEPVAEESVAEEPVAEEPVAEEPVAEEPAAEEPVAEEPAAEEPVVEAPAFVFCAECGQKLVPTAKFCSRCGHPR